MLALHSEPDDVPLSSPVVVPAADPVAFLRAQIVALSDGLPESLLSRSPAEVRALALKAGDAADRAARRRARVGERPEIDDDTAAAAFVALDDVAAARRAVTDGAARRQKQLAVANGLALAALGGAAGLLRVGLPPFSLPVAATVASAAWAPIAVGTLSVSSAVGARRRVRSARARFAEALEASGFETLGALSARRIALEGWRRRALEAEHAEAAADRIADEWHAMAGRHALPAEADRIVARTRLLRAVQLRLLQALLEQHAARLAASPATATDDRPTQAMPVFVADADEPPADGVDPGWIGGALERLRGRRLRATS